MQRYSYSKLLALVRLQWNTKKMKNNKNFRIMWGVEGFLFSGPRWQRRQDSKLEVLCFSFPTFSRQKKKTEMKKEKYLGSTTATTGVVLSPRNLGVWSVIIFDIVFLPQFSVLFPIAPLVSNDSSNKFCKGYFCKKNEKNLYIFFKNLFINN